MPWGTLEIDGPEGITERDLKRAYAKKLKVTRPDRDPEGFQELRDAYEKAQLLLQWHQSNPSSEVEDDTSNNAGPEPYSVAPDSPTLPSELTAEFSSDSPNSASFSADNEERSGIDEVEQSYERFPELSKYFAEVDLLLKSNPKADVSGPLSQSLSFVELHPGATEEWAGQVTHLLTSFPDFNYTPPNSILVAELQNDQVDLAHLLLEKWVKHNDISRMRQLVDAILRQADMIYSYRAVGVYVRLCIALSISDFRRAQKIGELAYDKLGPNAQHQIPVDEALEFSLLCDGLSVEAKLLWNEIINGRVDVEILADDRRRGIFSSMFTDRHVPEELREYLCSCVSEKMAEAIRNPPHLRWSFGENSSNGMISTGSSFHHSQTTTSLPAVLHPASPSAPVQQTFHTSVAKEESQPLGWGGYIAIFIMIKAVVFMFTKCDGDNSKKRNERLDSPASQQWQVYPERSGEVPRGQTSEEIHRRIMNDLNPDRPERGRQQHRMPGAPPSYGAPEFPQPYDPKIPGVPNSSPSGGR